VNLKKVALQTGLGLAAVSCHFIPVHASMSGTVTLDSTSFLKKASTRGVSLTTLSVAGDYESPGKNLDVKVSGFFNTFVESPTDFTGQNMYGIMLMPAVT